MLFNFEMKFFVGFSLLFRKLNLYRYNLVHNRIFLIGKPIEGIWHTGIVVYGKEYFFGSAGIESCPPAGTLLGK